MSAEGLKISFKLFKSTAERQKEQANIDAAYAAACDEFNRFLEAGSQQTEASLEIASTSSNVQESLLAAAPVIKPFLLNHLKKMRGEVEELINGNPKKGKKPHPELKEIMTRALNATRNAVSNPTPKNLKEFFKAQHAVSRISDVASDVAYTMIGIGGIMMTVGLILSCTGLGATAGLPIMIIGVIGIGLLPASFLTLLASIPKSVRDRQSVAEDMAKTRRALPVRAS